MHGVGAFFGMLWSAATRPTPRRLEVNRQTETTVREGTILGEPPSKKSNFLPSAINAESHLFLTNLS